MMQFGKLPYEGLKEEDFLFPEIEQPYLSGTKNKNPRIYIGLSKWAYKEEEKRKDSPDPKPGTLPFYANNFNTIELNATHYAMPSTEQVSKWYNAVSGMDFIFCPKLYKGISHIGMIGRQKTGMTKQFLEQVKAFKEKLGTSFIQVPESHKVDKDKILEYLKEIPAGFELSVEVRNPEWFSNPQMFATFIKELNALNKGIVITDTPGRRDAVHMQLSNSTAFIRFGCKGDNELDKFRIALWKEQLYSWYLQGLEKCYFILHFQFSEHEDEFIDYVRRELTF